MPNAAIDQEAIADVPVELSKQAEGFLGVGRRPAAIADLPEHQAAAIFEGHRIKDIQGLADVFVVVVQAPQEPHRAILG